MAVMYYRDPADNQWKTLLTKGPAGPAGPPGPAGPGVWAQPEPPPSPTATPPESLVLWVDTNDSGDEYFVKKSGDEMTGTLGINGGSLNITNGGIEVLAYGQYASLRFGATPAGRLARADFALDGDFNVYSVDGGVDLQIDKPLSVRNKLQNPQRIINVAPPIGDNDVATKVYVDGRIWFGTLAQYNAIGTKDPNVLYCVKG